VSAVHDSPATAPRRTGASTVLSVHAALSVLLALLVLVVWAATGGGEFWPMWVWLGLAVPLAIHALWFDVRRRPPSREKPLLVHAQVTGLIGAILIAVWALAGFGTFWPAWAMFGLATLLGAHWIVVHRERLPQARERELVERVDELTRTRRGALDVQAEQLRRIERDLHDGAQARLVALSMQLGRAEERLEDRPETAALVRAAREEAGNAIAELRDLARGIAPPVLADRGLGAALAAIAARSPVPVELDVDGLPAERLAPVTENTAYFVVSEALANAAKHSDATTVRVSVARYAGLLRVEVEDDGSGGAVLAPGHGLAGLSDRLRAVDGALTVDSPRGGPTRLIAEIPCV